MGIAIILQSLVLVSKIAQFKSYAAGLGLLECNEMAPRHHLFFTPNLISKINGYLFVKTYFHAITLKITLTAWAPDANYIENSYQDGKNRPPGGLEPPTFRLTAERANRLGHGDFFKGILYKLCALNFNLRNVSARSTYLHLFS